MALSLVPDERHVTFEEPSTSTPPKPPLDESMDVDVDITRTVQDPSGAIVSETAHIHVPAAAAASGSLLSILRPTPPLPVPVSQPDVEMETVPQALVPVPPPPEPPRTPSPPPGPPPEFVLDGSLLEELGTALVSKTARLNLEQLEQLRAACFDAVWRARAEWDRNAAVRAMRVLVDELVAEAEADDEED